MQSWKLRILVDHFCFKAICFLSACSHSNWSFCFRPIGCAVDSLQHEVPGRFLHHAGREKAAADAQLPLPERLCGAVRPPSHRQKHVGAAQPQREVKGGVFPLQERRETTEWGGAQSTVDSSPRSLDKEPPALVDYKPWMGGVSVVARAAEGFPPQEKATEGRHCLSRFGAFTLVRENKTWRVCYVDSSTSLFSFLLLLLLPRTESFYVNGKKNSRVRFCCFCFVFYLNRLRLLAWQATVVLHFVMDWLMHFACRVFLPDFPVSLPLHAGHRLLELAPAVFRRQQERWPLPCIEMQKYNYRRELFILPWKWEKSWNNEKKKTTKNLWSSLFEM